MSSDAPSRLILRHAAQSILACDHQGLSRFAAFALVTCAIAETFGLSADAAAAAFTVASRQLAQRSPVALVGGAA